MENKQNEEILKLLYNKSVECPVCGNKFKVKSVKTKAYKMESKDSDFFIRYKSINPYFYDVWICQSCGYSSMKPDFYEINPKQIDLVKKNLTPKWNSRQYPDVCDVDTAIEKYKLSLITYYTIEAPSSKKALNFLKLAWMYRLKNDKSYENIFLQKSLNEFEHSFYSEDLSNSYIDEYKMMYLIGELNRRLGKTDVALSWFGKVITTPKINYKLKELARTQKDIIKNQK